MNPEKLKYYLQKSKMNKLQRKKKKKRNKRGAKFHGPFISKNSTFWLNMVLNN
jgi:hypothetical protein